MDKWVAGQGEWSRKDVRERIKTGKVLVNGEVETSPERKVSEADDIVVEGKRLGKGRFVYLMLHKPAGVLCATKDRDAPTVLELVPSQWMRKGLFPAGRLDKDTEGFVLLTNDGGLAHRLLSPKNRVPKTYRAVLDKPLESEEWLVEEFARGIALGGGDMASPARLAVLRGRNKPEVELTIYEGMYHQVKRMFARYGYAVIYLKRIAIGGLPLDTSLRVGECREMTEREVKAMTGDME